MTKDRVMIVGQMLIDLAEQLSDEVCEITADEILGRLEGRSISEEDAGKVFQWMNT